MRKIVVAVASVLLAIGLHAAERLFAIDRAGFLTDTNRVAFATFSRATLAVDEQGEKYRLPCRFSFAPGIGQDKCREIRFSSVSIMKGKKVVRQQKAVSEKKVSDSRAPLPKTLLVDSLVFDMEESPGDVVVVAGQGGGVVGSQDLVLYQMLPEKYFRYLCSNEAGGDYWRTRMLGKRVEYRIWPVCCEGDEYIVEYSDIKSRYFSKMTLIYARCGDSFRLRNVIIAGDYSYKGAPLKSDPATAEIRGDFFESRSRLCENYGNGIVETGCGVLRSQKKVKYTVYEKTANERFKIVIEICED